MRSKELPRDPRSYSKMTPAPSADSNDYKAFAEETVPVNSKGYEVYATLDEISSALLARGPPKRAAIAATQTLRRDEHR